MNSELDKELRRTRHALRQVEADFEAFVYSASHDLHAPVRAILHFSKMLQRKCSDKLNENELSLLNQLPVLALDAQKMLDALLRYSRVGFGSKSDGNAKTLESLNLQQPWQRAVQHIEAKFSGQQLEFCIAQDLPAVQGDAELLAELLNQLLDNAVQFNDSPNKCVTLSWRVAEDADVGTVFCLQDNGIGIAENARSRVFSIFTRLHHPGAYGDGLGVGLAIARKIVRLHGGDIWIEDASSGAEPASTESPEIELPSTGCVVCFSLGSAVSSVEPR